jgi:hypothetical protein
MSNGDIVTGGSCFNIKARSLRLGDFSPDEIRSLYAQHTMETGQIFEEEVYPLVWALTHGQPWLVNALADELTNEMPEGKIRSNPITLPMLEDAANRLVIARDTHIDQLADKLKEPRVRKVLGPMLSGEGWQDDMPTSDDIAYCVDLGLIRNEKGDYIISNGIYREVLPRELTDIMLGNMSGMPKQEWYLAGDGSIGMDKLLHEFQRFFRENIGSWTEGFDYKEAGFQLLLQAFLQRIINGGGMLTREYALGSRRVDLLIRFRYPMNKPSAEQKEQRIVIEMKVIRKSIVYEKPIISEAIVQVYEYAIASIARSAHLVICDELIDKTWDEKIYDYEVIHNEKIIHISGM